jgi:hypothetical protein
MTIEKSTALAVMNELEDEINRVLAKHGLAEAQLKCKYGVGFELKITSSKLILSDNGVNLGSREAQYYTNFGYMGLHAPLGTKFSNRGSDYIFIGISPSRRKFPIAARNLTEGTNVFFPDGICRVIDEAASAAASAAV